jgi:membrane-bound lytic murein transglycosylase F
MSKNHLFFFTSIAALIVLLFAFCNRDNEVVENQQVVKKPSNAVINKIKERNLLIATTDYNSTNYFVYRGEPMGYQYELLQAFADYLDVKLKIQINNDIESSFSCLDNNQCDVIALGLTVSKGRKEMVDFCDPMSQTRQILVQRKPENWRKMRNMDAVEKQLLRNTLDLAGKTVYIQQNTIYKTRLENLSDEIGADIKVIEHPSATVEELITMVANGDIDYTVCDEHLALVNKKYHQDIDIETAISFPQNLAWAVKKGADGLRDTINAWMADFQKTRLSAYLYTKYFKNTRTINYAMSEYHSSNGGKISPYDKIIKKYSKIIDWDWRLLASLIYQESRFHPEAKSWAGAFGLMQLMPHNAEKYGIDSLSSPEDQIQAGVKFIKLLDQQFTEKIENKEERTKFVLAAYNAGIAHVYDAQRLAEKYEKDPNTWNDNVDYYLLNKSKPEYYRDSVVKYGYCRGQEPYNFVYDILDRYNHYKNVVVQ